MEIEIEDIRHDICQAMADAETMHESERAEFYLRIASLRLQVARFYHDMDMERRAMALQEMNGTP